MNLYPYDYAVIGGDLRLTHLTCELTAIGISVCHYGIPMGVPCARTQLSTSFAASSLSDAVNNANTIVGPIPLCKAGSTIINGCIDPALTLSVLGSLLKTGQRFFAGCIPSDFKNELREKGVLVYDFMDDKSLAIYNSIATAEGAVAEAISKSPLNLHHSRCAVLGYGKCGSTLTSYLSGLFCHVTVFTNSETERICASILADRSLSLGRLTASIEDFEFIFNTIPALVVDETILKKAKSNVTIIDIATSPGGVDHTAAKALGLASFLCPSLPGRYAPLSSAKSLMQSLMNTL